MNIDNFMKTNYNEPFIIQRADPYVYKQKDGSYLLLPLFRNMTGSCFAAAERLTVWQMQTKLLYGRSIDREL